MKYPDLFDNYSGAKLIFLIIILLFGMIISACNFSYDDAPDSLRTGLHSSTPPFSSIYHGQNFRFPLNNCDEPQCHGLKLSGGNSGGPSCYSCHNNMWNIFTISHTIPVKGIYHHYLVNNGTPAQDCGRQSCHGSSLTGIQGQGYSCYSCHNPIPEQ